MTLVEMKQLFRAYIDDEFGDRFPDSGTVNPVTFLNRGQEAVQDIVDAADERYFSKGQDYTVVSTFDAYEFDLPTDFKTLCAAERLTGDQPIPAAWCSFADRHVDPRSAPWLVGLEDSPLLYLRGRKIGVVRPESGYTLRVWYTKKIPDLVNDADISLIPLNWHPLVVIHAAKLAFHSERRDASQWLDEYNREVSSLAEFIEGQQRQEPKYINIVEGDAW